MEKNRKTANEFGLLAEKLAVEYLVARGYVVREQRWRPGIGKGEIDIIAEDGLDVVFIEVKARKAGESDAIQAVDNRKMRNMTVGADAYLSGLEYFRPYRFDIITVSIGDGDYEIEHYKDAFLSPLFSH